MFIVRWLKHIWWWLFRGYTCDECGKRVSRRRGKAHVSTEARDVARVPLPAAPRTMPPEGLDPAADAWARRIVAAIKSGSTRQQLFTVLRCPECADAWAMRRIEKAAKEVARDLRAVVAWMEEQAGVISAAA